MQMASICACFTYADAWHMDMLSLYWFLSFSGQIRKIPKSDLNGVIVWQGEGDTAGGCSKCERKVRFERGADVFIHRLPAELKLNFIHQELI